MEDDKFNALVESHDLALMDYHGQTVLHITGTASLLTDKSISIIAVVEEIFTFMIKMLHDTTA